MANKKSDYKGDNFFYQNQFENSYYIHNVSSHMGMSTYVNEAKTQFNIMSNMVNNMYLKSQQSKAELTSFNRNFLNHLQSVIDDKVKTVNGEVSLAKAYDEWKDAMRRLNILFTNKNNGEESYNFKYTKKIENNKYVFTATDKTFKEGTLTNDINTIVNNTIVFIKYGDLICYLEENKNNKNINRSYINTAIELRMTMGSPDFEYILGILKNTNNLISYSKKEGVINIDPKLYKAVTSYFETRNINGNKTTFSKYMAKNLGIFAESIAQAKDGYVAGKTKEMFKQAGFLDRADRLNYIATGSENKWADGVLIRYNKEGKEIKRYKLTMKNVLSNLSIDTRNWKVNKYTYQNEKPLFESERYSLPTFTPTVLANLYSVGRYGGTYKTLGNKSSESRDSYITALKYYIVAAALKDYCIHADYGEQFPDIVMYSGTLYYYCDFLKIYFQDLFASNPDAIIKHNLIDKQIFADIEEELDESKLHQLYTDKLKIAKNYNWKDEESNLSKVNSFEEWENIVLSNTQMKEMIDAISELSLSHALWQLSKNGK